MLKQTTFLNYYGGGVVVVNKKYLPKVLCFDEFLLFYVPDMFRIKLTTCYYYWPDLEESFIAKIAG